MPLTSPMCVIDTETTGLTAYFHEVVEIAILPVNPDFTVNESVKPFLTDVCPEHFDRIEQKALDVNGKTRGELHSAPQRKATLKAFMAWFKEMGYGTNKMAVIAPIAHNAKFDAQMLSAWFDPTFQMPNIIADFLHYHWRDSMTAALYINDKVRKATGKPAFWSVTLKSLAKRLGITNPAPHTALGDALTTAEVYRKLVSL